MLENRIAVCFSGQLRTAEQTTEKLLNFFGDLLPHIDFFIHTWSTSTYPIFNKTTNLYIGQSGPIPVDEKLINLVRNKYNPIKMVVDDIEKYEPKYHKRVITHSGVPPVLITGMFQSLYESNTSRKNYEKLTNSKYKFVVRIRPDIIFDNGHKLIDELENIENKKLYISDFMNKLPMSIEDICWIATPDTMDIVCDFVLEREIRKDMLIIDWQDHLRWYLYKHDITPVSWKNNNLYIIRE